MKNLYQLSAQIQAIHAEIEDRDGELTPELEEALTTAMERAEGEVASVLELWALMEGEEKMLRDRARQFTEAARLKREAIEGVKRSVRQYMQSRDLKTLKVGAGSISRKSNARPTFWPLGDRIPFDLIKEVPPKLDLDACYRHWKTHGSAPEGVGFERGEHVARRGV